MSEQRSYHFILIDDSKLDCFIGEKVIESTNSVKSFKAFGDAQQALDYIQGKEEDEYKTIVLVDIQMPLMNGFDFIEYFEKNLAWDKKANYIINLLSSSINESDIIKAKGYYLVNDFLNKPIKKEMLQQILDAL